MTRDELLRDGWVEVGAQFGGWLLFNKVINGWLTWKRIPDCPA